MTTKKELIAKFCSGGKAGTASNLRIRGNELQARVETGGSWYAIAAKTGPDAFVVSPSPIPSWYSGVLSDSVRLLQIEMTMRIAYRNPEKWDSIRQNPVKRESYLWEKIEVLPGLYYPEVIVPCIQTAILETMRDICKSFHKWEPDIPTDIDTPRTEIGWYSINPSIEKLYKLMLYAHYMVERYGMHQYLPRMFQGIANYRMVPRSQIGPNASKYIYLYNTDPYDHGDLNYNRLLLFNRNLLELIPPDSFPYYVDRDPDKWNAERATLLGRWERCQSMAETCRHPKLLWQWIETDLIGSEDLSDRLAFANFLHQGYNYRIPELVKR